MSFLPSRDREYLNSKGIEFEEHQDGSNKCIILKNRPLPGGKYNHTHANIMIILPSGYPDAAPDMFYCMPWLTLANVNRYPRQADQPHDFKNQQWQRWSRHWQGWESGTVSMRAIIKRVEKDIEIAA